jgi:hypothetical protein
MLRLELLKVKTDLERELEDFVFNCSKCGLDVHWVSGLGVSPCHWAHREPAPHGEQRLPQVRLKSRYVRCVTLDTRIARFSRSQRISRWAAVEG